MPAITVEAGPLWAAIQAPSTSSISCAGNARDAIAPRPASPRAIAWLRSVTIRAASRNDTAPATHAAAISPWEWPITASGCTPAACHTAARETITAQETGWTTSTRSTTAGSSRTVNRSQSTNSLNAAAHSAIRSAKTTEESRSALPIPSHCHP
ncbi:hypothetical protein GCM10022420_038830 [Streptomyces iranensis]